jgi:hypothetical protein
MKRALTLGLLCLLVATCAEPPNRDFYAKLARFHHHYNLFMRAYLGCAKDAAYIEQCKPNLGTFDYYEFNHAAREAAPLFGLERPRD